MSVRDTVYARLKKLLRVKFTVDVAAVNTDTGLGETPIGFDDSFIRTEFRIRVRDWFEDLRIPLPAVDWDVDTSLAEVTKAITDASTIKTTSEYEACVGALIEAALDAATGQAARTVPVELRSAVRDALNRELFEVLLRDVSVDDLAGDRSTIVANLLDRSVI
jgi:hypothetical protein